MALKNFRAVTAGQSLGDAATIAFNWTGNTLRPLAPVNLRGVRDSSGSILIQWTGRSRIGGGIRPGTGTPLAEESEVYVVEIYSGSTLKRTTRVTANTVRAVTWVVVPGFDASGVVFSGGTVSLSSGGAADLMSSETYRGDFVFEYEVADTSSFFGPTRAGVALDVPGIPGSIPDQAYYQHNASGGNNAEPATLAPSGTYRVNVATGDRLSIHSKGGLLRFYKNYSGAGSLPLYEETKPNFDQLRFRAYARILVSGGITAEKIVNARMQEMGATSFNYSDRQQIDDFGSTQSSIKVRVYQESAIVGRGNYAEALL